MKSLLKKGLVVALATMGILSVSSANAATSTANFQVNATVVASCVVSASNVSFGSITPANTGTQAATGTITSTCTKNTGYVLALNTGSGTGTYATRKMAGATSGNTDTLSYNLYTDSGYTTVFGDGTSSSATVSGTGNGSAQSTTVYGQLPLNQYVTPDTYADTLTVTLTY